MPAWGWDADAWVSADKLAILANCHRPLDFPLARAVVEAPERALSARGQGLPGARVRQVGKASWNRLIKVESPVRLDCDYQGELEASRQRARQPVRRDWRNADHTAALPIVGEEGIRLDRNSHSF